MPHERRNPLPAGRYWIDVVGFKNIALMEGWLAAFKASVTLEKREITAAIPSPPPLPPVRPQVNWYLFTTQAPLVWLTPLGPPNIADPAVHSQSDTTVAPPPEPGFLDQFRQFGNWNGLGSLALLAAALYFFAQSNDK